MACYGDMYHSRKEEPSLFNDKKKNAAYWDAIDNEFAETIKCVFRYSSEAVDITDEELEQKMYGSGVLPEVRDKVIGFLKELGAEFPYIDEDM